MLLSVVIPAHNRPGLLREALQSVAKQTYRDFEVVVVDDGSAPPIARPILEGASMQPVTLIRHESAQGVPKAKNAGVRASRGEIILLLDDDDLLMPNAFESIYRAFSSYPDLDCLFMGVLPFGPHAHRPAENRQKALTAIIDKTKPEERDGLYFFSELLFPALLKSVPIDFQRPAARRGAWNIVGTFDESSLFSESAWAIRASCTCNVALTKSPLTQWRIHDSNFGWPSNLDQDQQRRRQIDNGIKASSQLNALFERQARLSRSRARMIRRQYSDLLFSRAYYLYGKDWGKGVRALTDSLRLVPQLRHLKLAIKYLIPPAFLSQDRDE